MVKVPGVGSWFEAVSDVPDQSGVNPFSVVSVFESDSGSSGGRPGVSLVVKGSTQGLSAG